MQQPDDLPSPFWANEISDLKAKLRQVSQKQEEFHEKLETLCSQMPDNIINSSEEVVALKQHLEKLQIKIADLKQLVSERLEEMGKQASPKENNEPQIIEKVLKEIEPRLLNIHRMVESATINRLDHPHPTPESKTTIPEILSSSNLQIADTFAQLLGEAAANEAISDSGEYLHRLLQLRDHLSSWLSQVGKSWKASIVHIVTIGGGWSGLEVHPLNIETVNYHQKVTCSKCGSITETLHVQCFVAVTSESASDCYVLISKGECVAQEFPAVYSQLVETDLKNDGIISVVKQAAVLHPLQDEGRIRFIIQQKIVVQ